MVGMFRIKRINQNHLNIKIIPDIIDDETEAEITSYNWES